MMVVKMGKGSPSAAATRKFQVAVKPMKLEGLPEDCGGGDESETTQKYMAIKMKWKGVPKLFPLMSPFQSKPKKEFSSQKIVKKGCGIIQWDEEDQWFENTCCFSIVSNNHDSKFGPWEISFNVLCGEKMDSKAKMAVIGRVSMNLSEIAWKTESSSIEQKLHLSLQMDGFAREATLTVLVNLVEIREAEDWVTTTRGLSGNVNNESVKARRRSLSLEDESLDDSGELSASEMKDAARVSFSTKSRRSAVSGATPDSPKKERWFSWPSRRFSFKRAKTKEEKSDDKTHNCGSEKEIDADAQPTVSSVVDSFSNRALQKDDYSKASLGRDETSGVWEEKELISRDGQVRLRASVFFASFDQRSDKAAGESACTALVAVISHWLHSNGDTMPNRLEFDNLILQGSSEWRKLCEDGTYVNDFPNKHFDLETVLRADIRPISISPNKSFVGFFGAETFEALKGAMSFDEIWKEISSNVGIYIVSWNDHFFVLKAEENAYYIVDTLGERLHEGCHQAYILKFNDKTIMQNQAGNEEVAQSKTKTSENEDVEEMGDDDVICSGKECCGEFIKRFLAAIPLKELEEEEKKSTVSYFSLHHRLQIEFDYSFLTSPVSSSSSSPLSSLTTSASSPFSE